VGGNVEEAVDARIIAATNQDLEAKIADGSFREDLYYRINVIPLHLPPLRERREDVPLLVDYFIDKYCRDLGIEPKKISVEAMKVLEAYAWPGNVRELENVIERTLALAAGDVIGTRDLPPSVVGGPRTGTVMVELPAEGLDLERLLENLRADLLAQALERTGGVQTQAAELLSMSFRSFRYYAKKAGLRGADAGADGDSEAEPGAG